MFCVHFLANIDPAQAISAIKGPISDVIDNSTDWAMQVGIGITSLQALYVLILKLLDN